MLLALTKFIVQFLPYKVFKLGDGDVVRYHLFEHKRLFSIYIHHIAANAQDRFHTHAFDALIYCINGGYVDEIKENIGDKDVAKTVDVKKGLWRVVPKLMNHRLTKAQEDTYTLLLVGPWTNLWTEEFNDGRIDLLTNGRRIIKSVKVIEK
jgi:hypothetical protein